MSTKSTRGRGDGDKNDDRDENEKMDVEGALALDLAELEAMLAIDSEQVRYDEQVKGRDFQTGECSTACSSVDTCDNQFMVKSNSGKAKRPISQDKMKKRQKRDAKNQVSRKTESPPLFLTEDDELENADSVSSDNTISASKDKSDNTRLPDSVDLRLSLTLTTPPSKNDNSSSIFTKPTPPDDMKRKNPRIYSYSPISRTRLTVPKRQFSPEPARKNTKILIGHRRITETIHLSDLTKILRKLKAGEFSLPSGFTLKYRKRFADESKSETFSVILQDCRDSDDINSLQLSSENEVENESKNVTSAERIVTSEEKEDEMRTPKSHDEQKRRRGRKRLKMNPAAGELFSVTSVAETSTQHIVKEESPTPLNISISKTTKGKPRKRAALIKLKRGKPRKNFTFHLAAGENTPNPSLPNSVPLTLSSSETSLKDSNRESALSASQSTSYVTNVSHSLCNSADRGSGTDEHEDSKIEVLDSGTSVIFSNIAGRAQNDAVKDDDYDDSERLHIVESGDEDDSCDIDNRFLEAKKERGPDNIITGVITKLIDQVCEARSLSLNLIMEPLRRPSTVIAEEPRRVPPLRIRIPQRREQRQRRPARVHDYSPPLPASRAHRSDETSKKRAVVTSEPSNDIVIETRQKRSTGNKESQRKCLFNSKETDINRLPQSSNQKSSVQSPSSYVSNLSPVLVGSGNEEDIIATPTAICEEFSGVGEKSKDILNLSSLPLSVHSQSEDHNTGLDATFKKGQECKSTGRSTRKRPISYEQLYPSLFSRRRKSNVVKTSAVTQPNIFDFVESDGVVKPKSDAEDGDAVLSGCLPSKKKRKRGQNSITDNNDKIYGEKLGSDTSVHEFDEKKDQINFCPKSGNLTDYDIGSYDGTRKKALTDVIKAESVGSTIEEAHHSGEKTRRLSNSSMRDGRALSTSEGAEQDGTVSSTSIRRRRIRMDSEGTNELSSNLLQSISKGQRRKSSMSIEIDTTKSEGNEVNASNRLKNKRVDSKSISDKTKQKTTYQNMPYFKRIAQRRKLNPLAIGLKSRSGDDNPSFFYREILLRGDDLKKEDSGDVVVDVDSALAIEGDDEAISGRLAVSVALEINKIVPRPETEDELEAENVDSGYLLTLDNVRTIFTSELLDRKRLLNDMLTIISAQYCSEIASENVFGGASIRYNTMVKNAHRLRDKVLLFTKDQRENAKWAHQIFLKHLAVPILATYVDLLRFCRITGRYLLDLLLEQDTTDKILNKMNNCIQDFISEKVLDPQTAAISKTLTKRHAKNICLLTVSPTFTHAEYRSRSRSHEYMFRVLLPNVADRVEPVRLNLPATRDMSTCEAVDHCIRLISRKVVEVHRKYPDLKIVLVGWGTSCVINHQVVQCMPNVSAIINFAFPMMTADGPRGDVDDDILLTYCPTLFIIGDQATDCDVRELQIMATRMIAPTGVIVVGSSNCDLHPSTLRLTIERFTHRTVQRALLDDVVDFLQLYCSSSTTHSFRLHPLKLVEVNDVDLSILRTSNLFSGSQTKLTKFGSTSKASRGGRASDISMNIPIEKHCS